jgi:1-phosphatidylinositol-4-phosphate 5-kinase
MPSKQRHESLRPIAMSQIFDLKGSLLKRFVSEEEQSRGERVLKDLNFCGFHQGTDNKGNVVAKRGHRCRKIRVGKERWASLSAALMNDIAWLRLHNIMDYSLLVGVGIVPSRKKEAIFKEDEIHEGWSHLSPSCYSEWVKDSGGLRARDSSEEEKGIVYYIGVIDILQEFNMGKRMESAYKQRLQMIAGKDPTLISAVDSSVYAKRFLEFMTNHIE